MYLTGLGAAGHLIAQCLVVAWNEDQRAGIEANA